MTNTKIKATITALLAKAEGTDNEFEQSVFMSKVNELLEKHQIELYQLGDDSDLMGFERGDYNVYVAISWAKTTIHQITLFYGCSTVWTREGKSNFRFDVVGRESNSVTANMMISFIMDQVREIHMKNALIPVGEIEAYLKDTFEGHF